MDRDKLRTGINELASIANTKTYNKIVLKIKKLIPEYIGEDLALEKADNNVEKAEVKIIT